MGLRRGLHESIRGKYFNEHDGKGWYKEVLAKEYVTMEQIKNDLQRPKDIETIGSSEKTQ